jgi:multidrug efflux pump subunit AcrA (membrane-fusion protein)
MASLYGGDVRVTARLRQLSDAADRRTRTFEARYVMQDPGASAPTLEGSSRTGLLSVPLGAVDDEGHGPGVWVIDPKTSKVAYQPVSVQSFGGESAEVSGALTPGETIVAAGGHYLHEGERVRPAEIQAAMQ